MVLHLPLKTMPDFPLVLCFFFFFFKKLLEFFQTQVTSRIFRTINTISHLAGLYVKTMRINGRLKIPQRELKLTIAPTSPFSPFSPGGPGKPCKEDKYSLVQRKKGHMRQYRTTHHKRIHSWQHKCVLQLINTFKCCVLNSKLIDAMR